MMDKINGEKDRNNTERTRELDDFWDIESLLPPTTPQQTSSFGDKIGHIETVEIELEAPQTHAFPSEPITDAPINTKYAPCHKAEKPSWQATVAPDIVYSPNHPLLQQVRVYRWRSSFRFYERFCATAKRLFPIHGEPCDPVPFFSYMPQYDQMNRSQLGWYLYWRDCVRAENYLPTDYSYIFLYLFEIINLPDEIPPRDGQRILCEIWRQYRKTYPLLNRYLADWICDYSLIHQLSPPTDILAGELRLIAESSSFREFYTYPLGGDFSQDAQIYLLFCSNYDYRKSKVYLSDDERAKVMDFHIPRAFSAVLRELEQQNLSFATTKMQKSTLSRDTFIGALCSSEMKRRIEIDYCSFSRSHELRFLITDILKYAENKLRSHFGIKSRLSIYGLPDHIKAILDAYFAQLFPSRKSTSRTEADRPAYEVLYDLPSTELSFEHAQKIEQSSWAITQQLVEAFDDSKSQAIDKPLTVPLTMPSEVPKASKINNDAATEFQPYRDFLLAVLAKDRTMQRQIARCDGVLPDAIAEQINNIAVDIFGDIVLEENGNGNYSVIEDYLDNIQTILENQGE